MSVRLFVLLFYFILFHEHLEAWGGARNKFVVGDFKKWKTANGEWLVCSVSTEQLSSYKQPHVLCGCHKRHISLLSEMLAVSGVELEAPEEMPS